MQGQCGARTLADDDDEAAQRREDDVLHHALQHRRQRIELTQRRSTHTHTTAGEGARVATQLRNGASCELWERSTYRHCGCLCAVLLPTAPSTVLLARCPV